MINAEVGPAVVPNERDYGEARCGMQNVERRMWKSECGMRNDEDKRSAISDSKAVRHSGLDPWFDRPFDRLMVLSDVEGLTTLSGVEGESSVYASGCRIESGMTG